MSLEESTPRPGTQKKASSWQLDTKDEAWPKGRRKAKPCYAFAKSGTSHRSQMEEITAFSPFRLGMYEPEGSHSVLCEFAPHANVWRPRGDLP